MKVACALDPVKVNGELPKCSATNVDEAVSERLSQKRCA